MVKSRGEGVCAQRRRDALDEGREFGGRVRLGGRRLEAATVESRRARERERRVLFDRHERVYQCRVEHGVVLVGDEEEGSISSVVAERPEETSTQTKRPAEREAGVVLFERQAFEAATVVVPSVRVERLVAEEVEEATAKIVRASARSQVDATAGGTTVFGGELVSDDLHLFDGFRRRLKALA